jgi:hypothetical protein
LAGDDNRSEGGGGNVEVRDVADGTRSENLSAECAGRPGPLGRGISTLSEEDKDI